MATIPLLIYCVANSRQSERSKKIKAVTATYVYHSYAGAIKIINSKMK